MCNNVFFCLISVMGKVDGIEFGINNKAACHHLFDSQSDS